MVRLDGKDRSCHLGAAGSLEEREALGSSLLKALGAPTNCCFLCHYLKTALLKFNSQNSVGFDILNYFLIKIHTKNLLF